MWLNSLNIFIQGWKNQDVMANIFGDNLEMQTVLPKQAKEELLAIYRDSCMMFLLTTRTFG